MNKEHSDKIRKARGTYGINDFIIENHKKMTSGELAKNLGVSKSTINRRLKEIGISLGPGYWEKGRLLDNYPVRIIARSSIDKSPTYGLTVPKLLVEKYNLEGKNFTYKKEGGKIIIYQND